MGWSHEIAKLIQAHSPDVSKLVDITVESEQDYGPLRCSVVPKNYLFSIHGEIHHEGSTHVDVKSTSEIIDELDYLKWFRCNADFGPADTDVINALNEYYEKETGKKVPKGWSAYGDDE